MHDPTVSLREAAPQPLTHSFAVCEKIKPRIANRFDRTIPVELLDFVVDPGNQKLIGNPAHGGELIYDQY